MSWFKKIDTSILKKINRINLLERYIYLIIGCLIASFAFNLFFLPFNIVCFGISGVSVITEKFGINPSMFMLIAAVILLIISFIALGFDKTKNSIIGSILFPITVALTEPMAKLINFDNVELLIIAIFGGVISGLGYGLIFKTGFTTGGTDILNQIVAKYFKISIGKSMLMVDGLIVLAGGFIFGIEMIMYGIVVLYIISMMSDRVILGISESKAFYIITKKDKEVKEYLVNYLNLGVTMLEVKGGFTNSNQVMIMSVIPTKMYFMIKEGISLIDETSFFVVTDAYEVGNLKK